MKLVYISSPDNTDPSGNMEKSKTEALTACGDAYLFGRLAGEDIVPITPLVNFPYLNNQNPDVTADESKVRLLLLSKCDEMWVAGNKISENMRVEIRAAARMEIPVLSMGIDSKKIQDAAEDLQPLLGEKHCYKNSNKKDYTNQLLVLKPSMLAPWAKEPENQLWIAENGFGISPDASGRAVYAKCLCDGEEARWNRGDFIGIANPDKLPEWAVDKLSEIQHEDEEEAQQ